MMMWGKTNKVVADIVRDIPYLARRSRSTGEFRMRLVELYGLSSFLCGVASEYMNKAMDKILPTLVD
jgi:hypothetical protein